MCVLIAFMDTCSCKQKRDCDAKLTWRKEKHVLWNKSKKFPNSKKPKRIKSQKRAETPEIIEFLLGFCRVSYNVDEPNWQSLFSVNVRKKGLKILIVLGKIKNAK
jgi:hypothetical protein